MAKGDYRKVTLIGFGCWIASSLLALRLGAVADASLQLITDIRLPRVLLASCLGMGLSVAGAALQVLFSNPLCEPYTLGISSGSALGAVIGATLGFQWALGGLVGSAFLGAVAFAGILYLISLRPESRNITLLLAGVMLGFFGSSLLALWIAMSDSNGLQGSMVWFFGDLSRARMSGTAMALAGVSLLTLIIWMDWRSLDALLLGEEGAETLGVDVQRIRRRIIVLTSLLIGICVSAGGMIGFVGLVVPHFSRRWVGSLHLKLIPHCAIWGAVMLTLADCLSRILVIPYELPVGVVTALIGSPLFLWIMLRQRGAS